MSTTRWVFTLVLDLQEGAHPRKFIPEAVSMALDSGEDLVDYDYEEVSPDFELCSAIED